MERLDARWVCLSTEPPMGITSDQGHLQCEMQDLRGELEFPSEAGYEWVIVGCLDGCGLLEKGQLLWIGGDQSRALRSVFGRNISRDRPRFEENETIVVLSSMSTTKTGMSTFPLCVRCRALVRMAGGQRSQGPCVHLWQDPPYGTRKGRSSP